MKMISLLFIALSLSLPTWSARFRDQVHTVDIDPKGVEHLLLLKSGRVIFLNARYFSPKDFKSETFIEVVENEEGEVEAVSSIPNESMPTEDLRHEFNFSPKATVLGSYSEANNIFRGMNRSWKSKTECTDRAHVWTYEEWKKHGLISRKVFLFFTNTYIRRYRFYWWFHVSPYMLVQSGTGVTEYVMDRRYTSSPRTMKSWTDVFIRSKRHCPVTTYRHYRSNKNGPEHCFAVKSNMYNRLPYHVRMQEDYGRVQTRFNTSEVNFSYRAFTRRGVR